jgi:hypothetical protein
VNTQLSADAANMPVTPNHRKPRLPDGICIYAVSDIHGCAEQLANVFAAIDHHLARVRPRRPIHVFLGDYIDRGPESSQVIDMLIDRRFGDGAMFLTRSVLGSIQVPLIAIHHLRRSRLQQIHP